MPDERLLIGGLDTQVTLHQMNRGANLYDYSCDSKSICKSVHLSSTSSRLAIGLDKQGKGLVALWDTTSIVQLKQWHHEKPMWAVRLSPDARLLAAAGWDMRLTLYSTSSFAMLQQISYEPAGGPAFIWSLEWSEGQSRLALGCWDHFAYLYALSETDTHGEARKQQSVLAVPPLTEISRVKRADRVYAVALDHNGGYMVTGGRDKRVAMYDTDRGEGGHGKTDARVDAVAMWDVPSDDFVYCIALSADMQFVAFGGTAKKVSVLSAMSGAPHGAEHTRRAEIPARVVRAAHAAALCARATGTALFEVPQPGVIWSVALMHSVKGWRLAIGGELPVLHVINVDTQADELQLPVGETVLDEANHTHGRIAC